MPKLWIYHIALVLPMIFSILVLYTGFAEWLWYRGHEQAYFAVSALAANEMFREFMGGWVLPLFTVTVICYWTTDIDGDTVGHQFLLLPLAFVPFSIVGAMLSHWEFDPAMLYTHPLVIIPGGYLYLFPWILFIWVFEKLRLVM